MQLGWGTDGFWMGAGWIQDRTRTWADGDWDAAGPGCMQMVGVRMQLGCTGIEHGWGWGDIRTQVDGDRNAAGLGLGCRWERVRCSRLGSGCGQFGVRMQLGWDENGTRSDGDSDADGSGMEHGWVRDGMRTRADGDGDAAGARSGRSRLLRVRAAWGEDAAGMGPRWAGVGSGGGGRGAAMSPPALRARTPRGRWYRAKCPARSRPPRGAALPAPPPEPPPLRDGTGRDGMARDPQHGRVGAPHSAPPPTWQHGEGREAAARRAHGGGLCPQSPARTPPRPAELRTALPGGGGAGGGAAAEPVWGTRVRWGYGSPHPIRGARCLVRCCRSHRDVWCWGGTP